MTKVEYGAGFEGLKGRHEDDFILMQCMNEDDDDRRNISGVFFDPEVKMAVSTNGHRLFASRNSWNEKFSGRNVIPEPYFFDGKAEDIEVDKKKHIFPSWIQTLDDEFDRKTTILVPQVLGLLRLDWEPRTYDLRCVVGSDKFVLTSKTKPEEVTKEDRVIQLQYFKIFAGRFVSLLWSKRDNSAVLIVPGEVESVVSKREVLDSSWLGLIMPMRV